MQDDRPARLRILVFHEAEDQRRLSAVRSTIAALGYEAKTIALRVQADGKAMADRLERPIKPPRASNGPNRPRRLNRWIVRPRVTSRDDPLHWHPFNVVTRFVVWRVRDMRRLMINGARYLLRFEQPFGYVLAIYTEYRRARAVESGQSSAYLRVRDLAKAELLEPHDRVILLGPSDAVLAAVPFLVLSGALPPFRTAVVELVDQQPESPSVGAPDQRRDQLRRRISRLGSGAVALITEAPIAPPGITLDAWLQLPTDATEFPQLPPVAVVAVESTLLDIDAGNSTVLQRQIQYLADRGYATVVLAANPPQELGGRINDAQAERLYHWPILAHTESWMAPPVNEWRQTSRILRSGGNTFTRSVPLNVTAFCAETLAPECFDLLEGQVASLAIANYVWTVPMLRQAGYRGHLVCETHDIQSLQRARYLSKGIDDADLQAELGALEAADALIAISQDEAEFFRARLRRPAVHYAVCGFEPRPMAPETAADTSDIDAICRRSGPERADDLHADKRTGPIDLLFVGSHNGHNLNGLLWLTDQVLPLIGQDVRLVVAGSILKLIDSEGHLKRLSADLGIRILGRVDDLEPLYRASRLVTVPLLSGEGTSIKTVEAMSFGKPVVATPKGLRGLGDIDYPCHADAAAFAAACERLLGNSEERAALGEESFRIASERFSLSGYFNKIDVAMKPQESNGGLVQLSPASTEIGTQGRATAGVKH